jgi:hypothetical protein
MEKLEGIELTDLTRQALKWYSDETGKDPKEILIEAVQGFLDRQKANKALKEALGDNMLTVQVMLFGPFVDFIEKYRQFFGSPNSLEQFCRQAIYDKVNALHKDLREFVETKTHMLDSDAWYQKHSHIAIVSTAPEDESE